MNRILIAGYGKMGSWLCTLLGKKYKCAVYEIDNDVRNQNPNVFFIDSASQISDFEPEIFINCVNLSNTITVFRDLSQYLTAGCILSDITSVKNDLQSYYSNCGHRFVSIHPMFGPTFTDMSRPVGRTAYLIGESDSLAKKFFNQIFIDEGIKTVECTFNEHDRLMSKLLSLPVLQAILFAGTGAIEPVKGTTYEKYHDLTRMVLGENQGLLNSILANPYTVSVISEMIETLSNAKDSILSGKPIKTEQLFNQVESKR